MILGLYTLRSEYNMGLLDKTKQLGKKTVSLGAKVGHKGVDATKNAMRKKTCPECKYYAPIDDNQGDCPIGGRRLATADIATCPQKAFTPYEADIQQYPQNQQYYQQSQTPQDQPQQYPPQDPNQPNPSQ